jgi:hypothetical protein
LGGGCASFWADAYLQLPDVLCEQRGKIDTVIHSIDPAQTFGHAPPRLTIVSGL